jgi:hypothetical protein
MNAQATRKTTKIDALGLRHTYRLFIYGDGSTKIEDWIYDTDGTILAINEYRNIPQPNLEKLFA